MIGVFEDAEFRRIRDLPRRPQSWSAEQSAEAVELMTDWLRTPNGTMKLKPIQARALVEAVDVGNCVLELAAGAGKTILSFLLFTAWDSQRGLLLVPASLRQKTLDEYEKLKKHWRLRPFIGMDDEEPVGPHVRVLSYSTLSTVRFASFLEEQHFDTIVCDEAQNLANLRSARGRRIFRYLRNARKTTPVRFVPMSGTMKRKRLQECAHLYAAALDAGSPIPADHQTLEQWSCALDEGIREENRMEPGALWGLCTPEERSDGVAGARSGFRRRSLDTPGVVATSESSVDVPLVMRVRHIEAPAIVKDAFSLLRSENKLVNGDAFKGGLPAWQHAVELATGFSYVCDPPPPPEWIGAKGAWREFVGKKMSLPSLRLDSPLMVWNAAAAGKFGPVPEFDAWRNIKDTFTPNTKPLWVSDFLVRDAEDWALRTGGIVWLGHASAYTHPGIADDPDIADALGKLFKRIPYFGGGKKGDAIRTHKGPCAASIRSHGEGKDLVQWDHALITSFPSSGKTLEQLLARHQRDGQKSDEVVVEFYLHTLENLNAFKTATAESTYAVQMNGSPSRLLDATILKSDGHAFDIADYDALLESDDPMWAK